MQARGHEGHLVIYFAPRTITNLHCIAISMSVMLWGWPVATNVHSGIKSNQIY